MAEETIWWLRFIGILFQFVGIAVGVYTFTQIKYRKGIFNPKIFDPKIFNTGDDMSNLPKHPKTNKPIFPLEINKISAAISVGLIMIGIILHIVALWLTYPG